MMQVTIPWPPSKASSNGSQGDWRGKASARASYKTTCGKECIAQKIKPMSVPDGYVAVTVTYHPPRNGRVDWDNIANRCKQGFDAIAEATAVDDGRWWPVLSQRGDKVAGGAVVVEIRGQV